MPANLGAPARPSNGDSVLAVRGLRIVNVGRISHVVEDGPKPHEYHIVIDGVAYHGVRWIATNRDISIWALPNAGGEQLRNL